MLSFREYCSLNEGRPALKSAHQKTIEKLEKLNSNLNKYAHRWGDNTSARLLGWADEYDAIKSQNKPTWEEFCKKNGLTTGHNSQDCLA